MQFRTGINGLRGIAISMVVAYHYQLPTFQFGYLGVDIFFVISGFLISSILFRAFNSGDFSLIEFYIKRAYRIFPSLLVVILALMLFGMFFLYENEYKTLLRHIGYSLTFLSNHYYSNEFSYFDDGAVRSWLLHTWSLSVELQFYIFYPLFFLILSKLKNIQTTVAILTVLIFISFLLSFFYSSTIPQKTFYLLPFRLWEFLLGATAFFISLIKHVSFPKFSKSLLVISIFLLFLLSQTYIGTTCRIVTICLFVSLMLLDQSTSKILNSGILQYIGNISYSLYLVHWPVYLIINYLSKSNDYLWVSIGLLTSVLISHIMLQHVERPLIAYSKSPARINTQLKKTIFALLPLFLIFISSIGLYFNPISFEFDKGGAKSIFLKEYENLLKTGLDKNYRAECDFYDKATAGVKTHILPACINKNHSIFLWGDSHAMALSYGITNELSKNIRFSQVATSGCAPSVDNKETQSILCSKANSYALSVITNNPPKIVILAQSKNHENTDWHNFSNELKKLGVIHVVLIGPAPQWLPSLPILYVRYAWNINDIHLLKGLNKQVITTDKTLSNRYSESNDLHYISLIKELCDAKGCKVKVPGSNRLTAIDYGHLSFEASNYLAKKALIPYINKILI